MSRAATDDRAVSQAVGVLILVLFTVVITATVGLNVLLFSKEETGVPEANFTYRHIGDKALIVTYSRGPPIKAGNVTFRDGEGHNATWATLANMNATATIDAGKSPQPIVRLGPQNEFGTKVMTTMKIRVYYVLPDGNETQISSWEGGN